VYRGDMMDKNKENSSNKKIATIDSWKTFDMPEDKVILHINKKYSKEEYNKIKQGFIPEVMEEKWFIYFKEQKLYIHRSWTGYCIYQINFSKEDENIIITRGYLNGKIAEQRDRKNLKDEANTVLFLIDMLLLDKDDFQTDWGKLFV